MFIYKLNNHLRYRCTKWIIKNVWMSFIRRILVLIDSMNKVMVWSRLPGWTCTLLLFLWLQLPIESKAQEIDFRGRLHMDMLLGVDNAEPFSNGFNNRRARLGLNVKFPGHWDGRMDVDFGGADVRPKDFRLRRSVSGGSRIWIGQYKVPQGLNELTSSNNITFIERATPNNIVSDSRRLGVAYDRMSDVWGVKSMVYGHWIGDGGDIVGDMPVGLAVRGIYAPSLGSGRLHLATSVAYENLMDNTSIEFNDRPEARDSKGGPVLIRLMFDDEIVESTLKRGFEVSYINDRFFLEGEYFQVDANLKAQENPGFSGWYVQAGYLLTGGRRAYSPENLRTIIQDQDNDSGAWELAVRFSDMNLNDAEFTGGRQRNITIGGNRYLSTHIRFMVNATLIKVTDTSEESMPDANPVVLTMRAQFNF